jgi:uncharacterized membrane protein YkoI
MLRVRADRRVVKTAVTVAAAVGIGLGAYSLGSAVETAVPQPLAAQETIATPLSAGETGATQDKGTTQDQGTTEGKGSAALTLEEAKAVAARAASAPGRVIEWDQDNEPTGLRYDVTLLHDDGTTTDVEVDTVTGQVTSIDHDTDRD